MELSNFLQISCRLAQTQCSILKHSSIATTTHILLPWLYLWVEVNHLTACWHYWIVKVLFSDSLTHLCTYFLLHHKTLDWDMFPMLKFPISSSFYQLVYRPMSHLSDRKIGRCDCRPKRVAKGFWKHSWKQKYPLSKCLSAALGCLFTCLVCTKPNLMQIGVFCLLLVDMVPNMICTSSCLWSWASHTAGAEGELFPTNIKAGFGWVIQK